MKENCLLDTNFKKYKCRLNILFIYWILFISGNMFIDGKKIILQKEKKKKSRTKKRKKKNF